MMRKLLILVLVLGMSSTAGAALSLGGDTIVGQAETAIVTVISDDTSPWTGYIGFDDSVVGVSGCVATSNAGEDAVVTPDPYGWVGWYEIEAADDSEPFDSIQPGVQFEISVFGEAIGDVYIIELYAGDWATLLDSWTVVRAAIPEPMTIALLGLGGLFLLRRRK